MEKPSTIRLHFVLLVIVSALTLVDCLPAQALTTIYNFTAQSTCCGFPTNNDGSRPVGVIALGNTLYGTAQSGGISGIGTVFKVNVDGTGFTVLHYFTNSANPLAGLISSGNTLFGTTECCYGSVFAINTDGMAFRTLHFFPFLDSGMSPRAPLVMSGITLYGTSFGATPSFGYQPDPGSVFEINKDGTGFRYLYVFSIFNSGGAYPQAGLISSGDTFYG
ncbi:MAG TPA: choice-of-anchor tandem repeat GloVer-containing protein [Verrucomicrobiae bacterium]|nr:choice-of-anchor tandem repeat GloVer-containing protein [Verrucomicrobiae bacterium]